MIKPKAGRVLLKLLRDWDEEHGAIIIPEKRDKRVKFQVAEVTDISAIPEIARDGIEVGDEVLIAHHDGTTIKDGEHEHIMLQFSQIVAILSGKEDKI